MMASCTTCETCDFTYFRAIAEFFEDNKKSLQFLRSHGVLPNNVTCPKCGKACILRKGRNLWRCTHSYVLQKRRKRYHCNFCVSDFKGSFLDNARIPPWKVLVFVNHFISHLWDHKTTIRCLNISGATSTNWRSFCCEVTDKWIENQEPIGGEGVEVEIGETLIMESRYEEGKVLDQIVLIGGIERKTKRRFIVPLTNPFGEKRSKETFRSLIKKHVKPGSIIYSDSLAACEKLNKLGYQHFTVNQSEIKQTNEPVSTAMIEQLLNDAKEFVRRPGMAPRYMTQYVGQYLFISSVEDNKTLLHKFFIEAAKLYPPQSDRRHKRVVNIKNYECNEDSIPGPSVL